MILKVKLMITRYVEVALSCFFSSYMTKFECYLYRSIFSSEQPLLTIENFEQLGPSELIYWPVKEMLY